MSKLIKTLQEVEDSELKVIDEINDELKNMLAGKLDEIASPMGIFLEKEFVVEEIAELFTLIEGLRAAYGISINEISSTMSEKASEDGIYVMVNEDGKLLYRVWNDGEG